MNGDVPVIAVAVLFPSHTPLHETLVVVMAGKGRGFVNTVYEADAEQRFPLETVTVYPVVMVGETVIMAVVCTGDVLQE